MLSLINTDVITQRQTYEKKKLLKEHITNFGNVTGVSK